MPEAIMWTNVRLIDGHRWECLVKLPPRPHMAAKIAAATAAARPARSRRSRG